MAFQPELFTSGCDRPLPVDQVVDEYEIAEIIPLRVQVGAVDIAVLVNPFGGTNKTIDEYVDRGLYRRSDGTVHSYASVTGGVSLEHLAADDVKSSLQPLVETVRIESPLGVLATSQITVGDEKLDFTLDAGVARALLDAQPALIRATNRDGVRRIEVTPIAKRDGDKRLTLTIADLPDFLEHGTVDLGGRSSPKIKLDKRQLRQIVSSGRTVAALGDAQVELVTTAPQPAIAQSALTSTPAPTGSPPPPPPGVAFGEAPIVQPTLASLPLALYLPVRQRWTLDCYSRGALLHTVALAPQEELTLEVHSWQKFTTSKEDTTTTEATITTDSTDTNRDSNDVLNELGRTTDLRNNVGGNLGYSGYGLTVKLDGGVTDNATVTDTARHTTSDFHELVVKTTSQLKSTRQVKVTEGSDVGSEERVTRHLRNPNMCRALSIDTFEVLSHYTIKTAISRDGARPCVLIDNPLPFGFFSRSELREYESILSKVLLEPSLQDGFAAARLLAEREFACRVACERCLCGDTSAALLGPGVTTALARVRAAAKALGDDSTKTALSWVNAAIGPGANSNAVQFDRSKYAADADRLHRWMYIVVLRAASTRLYELLIDPGTLDLDPVIATRSLLGALATIDPADLQPDRLFARWRTSLESALYQKYQSDGFQPPQGGQAAVVAQTATYWGLSAKDEGLADALKALLAATQPASTDGSSDAQDDPVKAAYPVQAVCQALEREEALLAHLNQNRDYYRARIFVALPRQTQQDLLRSRGYDLPGIELRPLGREGSALAFPLAGSLPAGVRAYLDRILTNNAGLDPDCGTTDVVLPTAGVYLQTRLSECDACEPYIQKIRSAEVAKRRGEAEVVGAQADQERLEAQRYKKRLEGDSPLLDDPSPTVVPQLRVVLEKEADEPPVA